MNIRINKAWVIFMVTSSLIFLAACSANVEEENIRSVEDEGKKEETSIVPSYELSKENYKMLLPFRPSQARGVITNQIANRVDIDEVESGLRRHSVDVFDPSDYFFEEGQFITEEMAYQWLGRLLNKAELEEEVAKEIKWLKANQMTVDEERIRADLQLGLNPAIGDETSAEEHKKNPRYLSHVLEQNFLRKNEDNSVEVAGVSIALSLRTVYRYQTDKDGPYYYEDIPKNEMMEEGKKMAQKVLERIRKIDSLESVPVMIALYQEEEQSSPVPGNFIAKTSVPESDMEIGEWENIDEEYVLFPSSRAKEKYFEEYELVNSFGNDIAQYFPNYVGVVGEGFYVNEELNKLSITIPIEFYGSGEIIGFTQYAYGIVKELFGNYYDLEIKIKSSEQIESIIYQEAGEEEPTVHILH